MPCVDAAPDAVAMPHVAHRRVHLQQRAEPGIVVGRQRQVMRRRLAGRHILVGFEEGDLLGRRDVQHVDAGARPPRDRDQPLGRAQRRDLVAPDRMRRRIALDAQAGALAQPELVLGVEGGAAARVPQDRGHAVIVLDQQVAGRRAHEHLYAGSPRQPLELADIAGVVARAADPEGEVAMHAVRAAPHLVGERLGAGGQRIGVGHLEHGGDAAEHGGARAAFEVLLVLERPARGSAPGCRSRRAGRAGRGSRSSNRRSPRRDRRSRRCGRARTPMSRRPAPSWLTTVPPFRIRS